MPESNRDHDWPPSLVVNPDPVDPTVIQCNTSEHEIVDKVYGVVFPREVATLVSGCSAPPPGRVCEDIAAPGSVLIAVKPAITRAAINQLIDCLGIQRNIVNNF